MYRGIPTEEVLERMRRSEPLVYYVVGTSKGLLSRYEQALMDDEARGGGNTLIYIIMFGLVLVSIAALVQLLHRTG